jgi:acyl dehydratase
MSLIDGPLFDDLKLGDHFDSAPRVTLNRGLAAVHHSIVGGRFRLAFDIALSRKVIGGEFASPALVTDIAIGQSTLVTQRAIANLFYRGLSFLRMPVIGDTLATTTTIVGLRPVTPKPGRPPRGLVVMRIRTVDQEERLVLNFHRCAMLPARTESAAGAQGVTEVPPSSFSPGALSAGVEDWNLGQCDGWSPRLSELAPGAVFKLRDGDVVSSAPELARLTMNLAAIHHDRSASSNGERLVYGGHTIGIALAQITRALPSLLTVIAWHDCDHLGPVREGDTLHSEISVEKCEPRAGGGGFVHLRSLVEATDLAGNKNAVLDWRLVGLFP